MNTETKWGNQAPGIPTLVQSPPTSNSTDMYNQQDNAKVMSVTSKPQCLSDTVGSALPSWITHTGRNQLPYHEDTGGAP